MKIKRTYSVYVVYYKGEPFYVGSSCKTADYYLATLKFRYFDDKSKMRIKILIEDLTKEEARLESNYMIYEFKSKCYKLFNGKYGKPRPNDTFINKIKRELKLFFQIGIKAKTY